MIPKHLDEAKINARWQMEQESESSVMGMQFAKAIASIAVGQYKDLAEVKKKKKVFPPFKKIFYDEVRYNPPLGNTHMSYEYNAHYKEEERYWKRTGTKFSDDPKVGNYHLPDQGPKNPPEFPYCMERPVKVYGRSREVQPFATAHKYNKPVERTVNHEVFSCEVQHLSF